MAEELGFGDFDSSLGVEGLDDLGFSDVASLEGADLGVQDQVDLFGGIVENFESAIESPDNLFGADVTPDDNLFEGFSATDQGLPSFSPDSAEEPSLFPSPEEGESQPAINYRQPMTHAQRVIEAAKIPRAEGIKGAFEEAWTEQLSPSGKNGLLRAAGILGGSAAGTQVALPVAGAIAMVPGLQIPAAVIGLAIVAGGGAGGKFIADKFSGYDEKVKAYAAARVRAAANIYESEKGTSLSEDQALINEWENLTAIEDLQDKSFFADAVGFSAEMLPYVAEFVGGMGKKAMTLGALLTNPTKAKTLYLSAQALKNKGVVTSVDDGIAMMLKRTSEKVSAKLTPELLDELATNISKASKSGVTKEIALDFLKTYKPTGLVGNRLGQQLTAGALHGVASAGTVGLEQVQLDKAVYEGTQSSGYGKAVARHVTEIMSEYLGAAAFDPIMARVTAKYVSAITGAAKSQKIPTKLRKPLGKMIQGMQIASERLQIQAGPIEYWEETSKDLADSMLGLNATADVPQSVRIAEALKSFIPHTEEQLDLLAKMQVMPLGAAAVFAAAGGRTDTQQTVYAENKEQIFKFITGAEGAPVIADANEFLNFSTKLQELLTSSEVEDRRWFAKIRKDWGDKIPSNLRYVPGSLADVWDKTAGKKNDLSSFIAEVQKKHEEDVANTVEGEPVPHTSLQFVKDHLAAMNDFALRNSKQGKFIVDVSKEEKAALLRLFKGGEVTSKVGGLSFKPSPSRKKALTPTEKRVVRQHTTVDAPDINEAFSTIDATSEELDLGGTTNDRGEITSAIKTLKRHLTRSGNVREEDRHLSDKQLTDTMQSIEKIKAAAIAAGHDLRVRLVPSVRVLAAAGYKAGGTTRVVNFKDAEGTIHMFISPEAGALDFNEDLLEIIGKDGGLNPTSPDSRKKMLPLLKAISQTEERLAEEEKAGVPVEHTKTFRAAIDELKRVINNSSPSSPKASRVENAEVFEILFKLINIQLSRHEIRAGLSLDSQYFAKNGVNKRLGAIFDFLNSNADIGQPLQEALVKMTKATIDVNQLQGSLKRGYDTLEVQDAKSDVVIGDKEETLKKRAAVKKAAAKAKAKKEKVVDPDLNSAPEEGEKIEDHVPTPPKVVEPKPEPVVEPKPEPVVEDAPGLDEMFGEDFESPTFSLAEGESMKDTNPRLWGRSMGVFYGNTVLSMLDPGKKSYTSDTPFEEMLKNTKILATATNMARFLKTEDPIILQAAMEGFYRTLRTPASKDFLTMPDEEAISYIAFAYAGRKVDVEILKTENGDVRVISAGGVTATEAITEDTEDTPEEEITDRGTKKDLTIADMDVRAMETINELVSALGIGKLNRRFVRQILRVNEETSTAARIAATSDTAYAEYLNAVHPDSKAQALVNLLVENSVPREMFHDLVMAMVNTQLPGVDEFNVQRNLETMTSDLVGSTAVTPRIREELLQTINANFLRFNSSWGQTLGFVDRYTKARRLARDAKVALTNSRRLSGLAADGVTQIDDWADPIYRFMSSLLNLDADVLRQIDAEYYANQLTNPEGVKRLDPPVLRMFEFDLKDALLPERGSKVHGALLATKSVETGIDPKFTNLAPARRDAFRKQMLVRFAQTSKLGSNVQEKGSIGASNLENVVRGMSDSENPYGFRKRDGGLQNNLLLNSHLFEVAEKSGWENLSQLSSIGSTDAGAMTASNIGINKVTTVEDYHESDLEQIHAFEFASAKVGDTYKAWIGPMGDKKQVWRIDRKKLNFEAAIRQLKIRYKEITDNDETLLEMLYKFSAPIDQIETEYQANFALTMLDVNVDMYGENFYSVFKDSVDLVKRRGSAASTGLAMLPEMWESLTGRTTMNAVVIEDPKLIPQMLEILAESAGAAGHQEVADLAKRMIEQGGVDVADGFALVPDEVMDLMQKGFGATITRTEEGSSTPRLNILKTIISNKDDLLKQSAGRLSKELAEADNGVINKVWQLLEAHKKNSDVPIDMIFFSSGAKRSDVSRGALRPFSDASTDEISFKDDLDLSTFSFPTGEKDVSFREIPIEDFRWQLNAQSENEPHQNNLPRQYAPVLAEFPGVLDEYLNAISAQIDHKEKGFDSKGVPLTKLINSERSPILANLKSGVVKALDPITRMAGEEQVAKWVQKKLQFQTGVHHAVEWPIASNNKSLREYTPMIQDSNGNWQESKDPYAEGTRMALAHVETNLKGVRRNAVVAGTDGLSRADAVSRAVAFIRAHPESYRDMFMTPSAVTENNVFQQEVREWELIHNNDGSVSIPGEPMAILRVPADNVYSVTVVRVANRLPTGSEELHGEGAFPNVVRTPLSVQVASGADFDVDKRFLMPLRHLTKKEGNPINMKDDWTKILFATMDAFSDTKNYARITAPLDNESIETVIASIRTKAAAKYASLEVRHKDKKDLSPAEKSLAFRLKALTADTALRIGDPKDAMAMYASNRIGRRGLGSVASMAYGLNILNAGSTKEGGGVRLSNASDGLDIDTFKGFDFTDPLTGETRTVEAGRTSFGGTKNYATTVKKVYGTFLNLMADHGKLQLIDKLGINDNNVGIAMSMLYAKGDFESEADVMKYLEEVVSPALFTPEVEEWVKLLSVATKVTATPIESAEAQPNERHTSWLKNVEAATGAPAREGFWPLVKMASDLQTVNRMLRLQFKDLSRIDAYSKAQKEFARMTRNDGVGVWKIADIGNDYSKAFEASARNLELLNKTAFEDSPRNSAVWNSVNEYLFRSPGEFQGEAIPAKISPTQANTLAAYGFLNQVMSVRALANTWDTTEEFGDTSAGAHLPANKTLHNSLMQYFNSTLVPLLKTAHGNPFLNILQVSKEADTAWGLASSRNEDTGATTSQWAPVFPRNVERDSVSLLNIMSNMTFSEAQVLELQEGFNQLEPKMKQALTLYALMRYGLDTSSYKGSYLQFVSPAYLQEIHETLAKAEDHLIHRAWTFKEENDLFNYLEAKLTGWKTKASNAAGSQFIYDPGKALPPRMQAQVERSRGLFRGATAPTFSLQEQAEEVRDKQLSFHHFISQGEFNRYQEAASIPTTPLQAFNWAVRVESDETGRPLSELYRKTKRVFDEIKDLSSRVSDSNEAFESAIVALVSPHYSEFAALEPLIKKHFSNKERLPEIRAIKHRFRNHTEALNAFRRGPEKKNTMEARDRHHYKVEADYLKGLMEGTIEPYLQDPGDQQEYRDRVAEQLGSAAKDYDNVYTGKKAPNLANSHNDLSYSLWEGSAIDQIIEQADTRTLGQRSQALLKHATRTGKAGTFLAGIAAQRLRRKVGATKQGYAIVGEKKLGDKLLEAITILIEEGISTDQTLEQMLLEVKSLGLDIFDSVERIPAEEREKGGPLYRIIGTESIYEIVKEYEASKKKDHIDTRQAIKEVREFFNTSRNRVNGVMGEEWIPEFRSGGGSYMLHLYNNEKSIGNVSAIQKEETDRVMARGKDTLSYREAAVNRGLVPRALGAADLMEQWDSTVSKIMTNRLLFNGLASMTDVGGNPVIVPERPTTTADTEGAAGLIDEDKAEDILTQLVASARSYYTENPQAGEFDWTRRLDMDVWGAINSFIKHHEGKTDRTKNLMEDLGYKKIEAKTAFGMRRQAFWVVKGPAEQVVKHLIGQNFSELAQEDKKYAVLSKILAFNRLIKTINVGFSAFHHFALMESYLADTGWTPLAWWRAVKNMLNAKKDYEALYEDATRAAAWVEHGLELSVVPMDVDLNALNAIGLWVADKFDDSNLRWMGARTRQLINFKTAFDNFLWHKMLPTMKMQMAEEALESLRGTGIIDGMSKSKVDITTSTLEEMQAESKAMEDIAKYVNDALGSQEWTQYLWATPYARDVMNLLMFAPDWTISALNISGVPEMATKAVGKGNWLGYQPNSEFGTFRRATRYWLGFFGWIFLGVPSALQAAVTAALGDDDDDDKWFTWQNEEGHKFDVDLTPIIRRIAKDQGKLAPTRRTYLRPGKQMREVGHWLKDPLATIAGKSSPLARGMFTGTTGIIRPSINNDEVWAARSNKEKWTMVFQSMMPFAMTSLNRQEMTGSPLTVAGAANIALSLTAPRVSGMSGVAAEKAITKAVMDFAKDSDVKKMAPAVAKKALDERLKKVRESMMRQGMDEKMFKAKLDAGFSAARTPINRLVREEVQKGAGIDMGHLKALLLASSLLYSSNKKWRSSLEAGIRSSMTNSELARTNPEKVKNMGALLPGGELRSLLQDTQRNLSRSKSAASRLNASRVARETR